MMEPAETTVKASGARGTGPKDTPVAPGKVLPKEAMGVPPMAPPAARASPGTRGAGALERGRVAVLLGVVTLALTERAACGGAMAVMEVLELTVKLRAGTLPKETS